MVKNHLKRIAAPRTWPIARKAHTFVRKPRPGMHSLEEGLSLETWLKEVLGKVRTRREARYALRQGFVKVNQRVVKDPAFSTGFLDIITLTPTDEHYLIILTPQRKLSARKIRPTMEKLSQIVRKGIVRGGRVQYTTREGYTFLSEKSDYAVGDAVIITLGKPLTIKQAIPLKEGSRVFVTRGENTGLTGRVKAFDGEEVILDTLGGNVRVKRRNILAYEGYPPLEEALNGE